MADAKISAFNELAAEPAADDELAIVDTDAGETKRIVRGNFLIGYVTDGELTAHEGDTSTHGAADIADVADIAIDANLSADAQNAITIRHAESHNIASHNDTTGTGAELETLTDGSNADALHDHTNTSVTVTHASTTGKGTDDHHNESHNIASHSDTTATGTELNTLVGAGDADALHTHNKLKINNKAITIEDPDNSEDLTLFFTDDAITVNQLAAVLTGDTTPSCTYTIRHHTDRSNAGNEVVTGGEICTSVTTGNIVTSFDDATIPANSWVWLETTAQSGNVDTLNVTIRYTFD